MQKKEGRSVSKRKDMWWGMCFCFFVQQNRCLLMFVKFSWVVWDVVLYFYILWLQWIVGRDRMM